MKKKIKGMKLTFGSENDDFFNELLGSPLPKNQQSNIFSLPVTKFRRKNSQRFKIQKFNLKLLQKDNQNLKNEKNKILSVKIVENILFFIEPCDFLKVLLLCKIIYSMGNTPNFWKTYHEYLYGFWKENKKENFKDQFVRRLKLKIEVFETQARNLSNIKYILMGDNKVGKTTFLTLLKSNNFLHTYEKTLGANYFSKDIDKKYYPNNYRKFIRTKIEIYDVVGNVNKDGYKTLPLYLDNVNIIFVFYDVSSKVSFEIAEEICYMLKEKYNKDPKEIILIGNKNEKERKVEKENVLFFCGENGFIYYELSCKHLNQSKITNFLSK